MQEHTPQTASPNKDDEAKEIEQLKQWMEHFSRKYKYASSRKERYEKLMRRPGAKKWTPAKTAKMVRRLVLANQTLEQSENALDQCSTRLSELGVQVEIVSRSGASTA